MSELTYYVKIERTFSREEIESGYASNFDLRAWEDSFLANTMEYWNGHGTSPGYSKLTFKSISKTLFKSAEKERHILVSWMWDSHVKLRKRRLKF